MKLNLFLLLTICSLLYSCAKPELLNSRVEVLEHSDCDNNESVLKLSATGGTAPYIYQIKHKLDNKIVYTEVSDENELILAFPDLNQIFYELHVIDDNLVSEISEFEIRAEGQSELSDILHLESNNVLYVLHEVQVNLYKTEFGHELYMETITNAEGEFTFEEIPTGIYTIEVSIPDKYNSYQLESDQTINDKIKVKHGQGETVPFIVNCRMNLDLDLVYKK